MHAWIIDNLLFYYTRCPGADCIKVSAEYVPAMTGINWRAPSKNGGSDNFTFRIQIYPNNGLLRPTACYLVRKFCIQIWNSVSDTIKVCMPNKCKFREIGIGKATLFTPQCTWRDLCLKFPRDLIIEMETSQMHSHYYQRGILQTTFPPVPLHCIRHFRNCSKDP